MTKVFNAVELHEQCMRIFDSIFDPRKRHPGGYDAQFREEVTELFKAAEAAYSNGYFPKGMFVYDNFFIHHKPALTRPLEDVYEVLRLLTEAAQRELFESARAEIRKECAIRT